MKEELTSAGADMAEQKENICWFTVFVGLSKYEYYVLHGTIDYYRSIGYIKQNFTENFLY